MNSIFCANINFQADESDIFALFGTVGVVRSVKLARNQDGTHKGFGFIKMADEAAVEPAIRQLNGYNFRGRDLYVTLATNNT